MGKKKGDLGKKKGDLDHDLKKSLGFAATMSSIFSAKRSLAQARGFMADFAGSAMKGNPCAYSSSCAWQGFSYL
jgi:hypothetical protein